MTRDDAIPTSSGDTVERVSTLPALQADHKDLLRTHRQEGDSSEMLDRIEAFIHQGQATGVLLDEEEDRWTAQGVLDYWSAILFRADRRAPDATLAEFDPELAPELPNEFCPYVGLDPFREETQHAFFGRERLLTALIEKLKDSRLLVVIGPSGSGKSSVVLAGLIPTLKHGVLPGSESWRYLPRMVPGSNPLANLARLVQPASGEEAADPVAWTQEQETVFRENPQHLLDLVHAGGEEPVVGVVDQFEELFTLCGDPNVRQAFIDNLLHLVQEPGVRHTIILTMRTDFLPFVARLPEFYSLFEERLVPLTPLSASELREAVEKPAEVIGLKFESGIVDQLLQDLLGEPAGLPLLQFTLLKLWESRTRNRITWESYSRLGSGRVALARSADTFYDELIPEDQVTAKRIFLRLVRPGEGLEFTSNRVRLRSLYQTGEALDRVDRVLEKLISAHLIRVSEGDVSTDIQIEVAHEALVRNWPQLVDWLEEERQSLRQRQSVSDVTERWNASGRDPGALYTTNTVLQEALRVVEVSGVELNEQEAEFILASEEAITAARIDREATRQREIEQANRLAAEERLRAEEQAAAAMRYRRLTLALIIVAVFAVIAFMVALTQRGSAVTAQATAEAGRRIAVAARTTTEAGATQVAANLVVAQDSLSAQVGLIDQLATSESSKATLSADVQELVTQVEILSTAGPTAIATNLVSDTLTPTSELTKTIDETPEVPHRTPSPTSDPTSDAVSFAATATIEALATQRAQVQETQVVIATTAPRSASSTQEWEIAILEGKAAYRKGDWEKVVDWMTFVIDRGPRDAIEVPEAYNLRGWSHFKLSQYSNAISDYTNAIELSPEWARPYNNRGVAYQKVSEHEKAIADFTRAINLDEPHLDWPFANRGWSHYQLREYNQALSDYDKGISLNPAFNQYYLQRAYTHTALGNVDEAIADFNECVRLDAGGSYGNRCQTELDRLNR